MAIPGSASALPPLEREVDLQRHVIALVQQRLPAGWSTTVLTGAKAGDRGVDALLEVTGSDRQRVLLVLEVEGSLATRDLPRMLEQMRAIYLHTGQAPVASAEATKDSDLALDPRTLPDSPMLDEVMTAAGFHRDLQAPQPGSWLNAAGIPVDLMVPESLAGGGGRRGARIPPTPHTRLIAPPGWKLR